MSKGTILSAIVLSLLALGYGQCQEWSAVINDLLSPDQAVSDAARAKAFGVLIPQLVREDAAAAAKEVGEISNALGSKDEGVRIQASALLASVATLRNDGTAVFGSAIPAVIRAFQDSASRVRSNAASAVSNLKPTIPSETLHPLLDMLHDPDQRAVRGAVYGVARFAASSEAAVAGLKTLLADHGNRDTRLAAMEAMAVAHVNAPELVTQLGEALDDPDSDVVTDALLAIQAAGSEAVATYRQKIAALAQRTDNSGVPKTAARVLGGAANH